MLAAKHCDIGRLPRTKSPHLRRRVLPQVTRMAANSFAKGLQGVLVKYGPGNANTAFVSGGENKHVVLLGGLGDGLLLAPYVEDLTKAANSGGWSLVQPTLTSALQGWGVGSLDQDANDILQLTTFLKAEHSSQAVILIGHSTGCQDAVRFVELMQMKGSDAAPLAGIVLQAPVSDREYQSSKSTTRDRLAAAEQMMKVGKGEDVLFRDDDPVGTPVCARRFAALASKHGDDDMFSSDFTDQELQKLLGHLADIPTLLVLGGEDECMPKSVDGLAFGKRMQKAIGSKAQLKFIAKGTHSLEGTEQEFVKSVQLFVQQCYGPGSAGIKPPYLYSCT